MKLSVEREDWSLRDRAPIVEDKSIGIWSSVLCTTLGIGIGSKYVGISVYCVSKCGISGGAT